MKAVKDPVDLSLVDVTLHVANLTYQYRRDLEISEDIRIPDDVRAGACSRMLRARELLDHWKEIRRDIVNNAYMKDERCIMLTILFYANKGANDDEKIECFNTGRDTQKIKNTSRPER